jgi:hypothetical protein
MAGRGDNGLVKRLNGMDAMLLYSDTPVIADDRTVADTHEVTGRSVKPGSHLVISRSFRIALTRSG